jgi:hypothetical protein
MEHLPGMSKMEVNVSYGQLYRVTEAPKEGSPDWMPPITTARKRRRPDGRRQKTMPVGLWAGLMARLWLISMTTRIARLWLIIRIRIARPLLWLLKTLRL